MKMKLIWKIGIVIGLVAVLAAGSFGISYAAPAYTSLTTFSWVESNDNGSTASRSGYNPIDPGDNGSDPLATQSPGVACSRGSYNAASASVTYTPDTLTFNLTNAYPGYHPTIFFGLSNQWPTPGIVSTITLNNPNPAIFTMTLNGVSLNQAINAGADLVGALDIAVGNLPQSTSSSNYSLSATIVVTQTGPALGTNTGSGSLPGGQAGVSYSQTLTASNGNTPYTWSVISGSLPSGLSLNPATGAITGTPAVAGAYTFTIQVTDSTGDTANITLSITISSSSGGGGGGGAYILTPNPMPTTTPSTTPASVPAPSPVPTSTPTPASPPTNSAPGGTIAEISVGFTANINGNVTEILANEKGTASSQTGDVTLQVANGTVALNADGSNVSQISINPTTNFSQPPVNTSILLAYDCGPEGATFNPPMVFTIHYDQLPAIANENGLYIALWNGKEWISLPSTIDSQSKTVSASVSHFSKYALMRSLVPNRIMIKIPSNTTETTTDIFAAPLKWGWIIFIITGFLVALFIIIFLFRKKT